jgi:hypothetical protein
MIKQTIINRIKDIVYIIVLPIYLWSIDQKSLNSYLTEIERQYDHEMGREYDDTREDLFK